MKLRILIILPFSLLFFNLSHAQKILAVPDDEQDGILSLNQLRSKLNLSAPDDVPTKPETVDTAVSNQRLLNRMLPQLLSRSVEQAGSYIQYTAIPFEQKIELLHEIIISDSYGFTNDDTVQLVLDIANKYAPGSEQQKKLFQLFIEHPNLLKKSNPLFIAVQHDYKQVIIPMLRWAQKVAPDYPQYQKDLNVLKYRALLRAVDEGDKKILQALYEFAQGISPAQATQMVWHIAAQGISVNLLPDLKDMGANIDAVRGAYTPLILAVERGHEKVVEQLISLDVNLDKIADNEFGSALQRAIYNRDLSLERMLRRAGARE